MTKEELLQEIYQAIGSEFFTDSAVLDKRCLELIQKFKGDAIAEHEAKQWQKYPENKPEKDGFYLVTRIRTIGNQCFRLVSFEAWSCGEWITLNNYSEVIAFRELPEAYQEGGEK